MINISIGCISSQVAMPILSSFPYFLSSGKGEILSIFQQPVHHGNSFYCLLFIFFNHYGCTDLFQQLLRYNITNEINGQLKYVVEGVNITILPISCECCLNILFHTHLNCPYRNVLLFFSPSYSSDIFRFITEWNRILCSLITSYKQIGM